ncbi:Ankyrin repeat protein [Giardia duodenalis]|uniref:Ankyrin repeat protein n=1 Tax=Giardia intestinalis TaxID=5741 RepID=V6TBM0_GIAIN|nr:Ankyrin repeat protein [Giardia intestinalis]
MSFPRAWFEAIAVLDVDAVQRMLPQCAKMVDDHGETGLMKAVRLRYPVLIKLLAPYEAGMTNNRGQTALMLAAHFNYAEGCKMLLSDEGNIHLSSKRCCLIVAAVANAGDAVRAILPLHRYTADSLGATALVYAAERGHLNIVRILLEEGDTASPAPDALRSLIVAVLCERKETALYLSRYIANFITIAQPALEGLSSPLSAPCVTNPIEAAHDQIDMTRGQCLSGSEPHSNQLLFGNGSKLGDSPQVLSPIPASPQLVPYVSQLATQHPTFNSKAPQAIRPEVPNTSIRGQSTTTRRAPDISLLPKALDSVAVLTSSYVHPVSRDVRITGPVRASSTRSRPIPRAIEEYESPSSSMLATDTRRAANLSRLSPSTLNNRSLVYNKQDTGLIFSLPARHQQEPGLNPSINSLHLNCLPGLTALMTAVITGQSQLIPHLAQTDAGSKTIDGWTALMFAVLYNKLESLPTLAATEAGLQNNAGETALMIAAVHNRTSAIIDLMHKESRIQDRTGKTALIHAVERGNYEAARMLSDNEHSMVDFSCHTAFLYACNNGYEKIAQLLVGLEGNKVDPTGQTGLMIAAEKNHVEILKLLVPIQTRRKSNAGITALMLAGYHGHMESVSILLSAEAQEVNENGATALMIAAMAGNVDVCRVLLAPEHGLQNLLGQTALMLAAAKNHQQLVNLLIPYESTIQDCEGRTALMYAAESQCTGAVEALLPCEHGFRDNNGCTAMMYAARAGSLPIVMLLARYEQRLVDTGGHCALIYSLKARWPMITEYLQPLEGDLVNQTYT